jgi:hypothetical protein
VLAELRVPAFSGDQMLALAVLHLKAMAVAPVVRRCDPGFTAAGNPAKNG